MPPAGIVVPGWPPNVSGVGGLLFRGWAVGRPPLVLSSAMVACPMSRALVPRALSSLMRAVLPETEGLRAMRKVWLLKFDPWKLYWPSVGLAHAPVQLVPVGSVAVVVVLGETVVLTSVVAVLTLRSATAKTCSSGAVPVRLPAKSGSVMDCTVWL